MNIFHKNATQNLNDTEYSNDISIMHFATL